MKILVIDDEKDILKSLESALDEHELETASTWEQGKAKLCENCYDLIILDMKLPDADGLEVIPDVFDISPTCEVVLITAYGSPKTAARAFAYGAYDYIEKPLSLTRLKSIIKHLEEERRKNPPPAGKSPQWLQVLKLAAKAALTDAPVLLIGETGTGKEVLADFIHRRSPRRAKRFVKINCAAIPDELLEAELFGYEKGAFTGATQSREGRIAQADGGTLLLDEIGELPLQLQAKLLRFIETGEIQSLGGPVKKVSVKLISATNRNLTPPAFREDLYWRLSTIPIKIPPLRERKDDIEELIKHFCRLIAEKEGLAVKTFSKETIEILKNCDLPGNARQLKRIVERAYILLRNEAIITKKHLQILMSEPVSQHTDQELLGELFQELPLSEARKKFEKIYIQHILKKYNNNLTAAAQAMGMLPQNLLRRMKNLGLR